MSVFLMMLYLVADPSRPLMTLQTHPVKAKMQTQGFLGLDLRLPMKKESTARGTRGDVSARLAQLEATARR